MKLKQYLNEIVKFLKEYLKKSGAKGYTLGLSGGVDSALTLALLLKAVKKENIHVVIIPIESNKNDEKYAINLCKKFKIKYDLVNLTNSYHKLKDDINRVHPLNKLSESNIKVRLRMVALYAIAQKENSLVVGTDNLDERYVGYFTKFGDGAADLLPIAKLTKGEVYQASKLLGVSKEIIERAPTAGLFVNQKDEDDLDVKYLELDKYLLGKKVSKKDEARIKHLHQVSQHKRSAIPEPKDFKR
ncbi:MAG: NAD(+) synthase [Bacilli bacterium]|nr:NAD(+) synthase [Bacilli bacterium]